MGQPQRIFQLQAEALSAAFPPLRSLDNPKLLSNLPGQVSSFIGREGELAEVRALVGGSRLVTLTGAGGAGKTRLGLQVAAGLLEDAGDGVWFADLAPLGDPELVAVTVADVLGVRQEPGRPVLETLVEAVGGRACWWFWTTASTSSAPAPSWPTRCCGAARIWRCWRPAASRWASAGSGCTGCRRWASRPTAMTPGRSGPARRCGCWQTAPPRRGCRWPGTQPAAAVAGRICRRLDGIPLAIELAAARLRVMPAAELDARLDERFALLTGGSRAALPRQQTLRAMVDWSWELLTGAERAVLARLSVFAGGFGLAAAEAVAAGPDVPAGEVVGQLGALVDKSLVQFGDTGAGPGRYRLLETVRQYAAGQLDAQGPAVGRRRPGRPPRLLPGPGRGGRPAAGGARSGRSGWTGSMPSWATCGPRSPSA